MQSQCCVAAGGDCPFQHNNGLTMAMSRFYDCVPSGTINSQLAQDACIAYVGSANAGQCAQYSDSDAGSPDSWCSGAFTGDCVCWSFSGTHAGTYMDSSAAGIMPPTTCSYGAPTGTFN
jgi:hypothetical protein